MIPKVSIIMAVYNEEKHIWEAIASALNQEMKNFELIIINDASTDGTLKIAEEAAKRDKRVHVFSHKKNKLKPTALNTGISKARGEYICLLDGDDLITKDKLELQTKFLDNNKDIDMLYTNMTRFFEDGKTEHIEGIDFEVPPLELLKKAQKRKDLGEIRAHRLINFKKEKRLIPSASTMLRRKVFKRVKFDERLITGEDYDLWFQIIGAGFKLAKLPRVTYWYRIHSGNITKNMEKRLYSYRIINKKLKNGEYFKR